MKEMYRNYLNKYKRININYQEMEEIRREYKENLIKAAKESCGVIRISNKPKEQLGGQVKYKRSGGEQKMNRF